jgi:hypothetical protein
MHHRPLLADPHFVLKALQGKSDEINTCIGCNQVNIFCCTVIRMSQLMLDICTRHAWTTFSLRSVCHVW